MAHVVDNLRVCHQSKCVCNKSLKRAELITKCNQAGSMFHTRTAATPNEMSFRGRPTSGFGYGFGAEYFRPGNFLLNKLPKHFPRTLPFRKIPQTFPLNVTLLRRART